jgi:hypothetical protein
VWSDNCGMCGPEVGYMQLKTVFVVALVALSATACGYTIKTSTDYDNTVDFGAYHTFSIMKGNSSGNPLLDQRAMTFDRC